MKLFTPFKSPYRLTEDGMQYVRITPAHIAPAGKRKQYLVCALLVGGFEAIAYSLMTALMMPILMWMGFFLAAIVVLTLWSIVGDPSHSFFTTDMVAGIALAITFVAMYVFGVWAAYGVMAETGHWPDTRYP